MLTICSGVNLCFSVEFVLCSSFRDSTYTDQDFGGPAGDDGSDSNGMLEHTFEGKRFVTMPSSVILATIFSIGAYLKHCVFM